MKDEPWLETPKPQYDPTRFVRGSRDSFVAGGFFSHRHALLSGLAIGEAQLDAFTDQDRKRLVVAPVTPEKGAWIYAIYRNGISAQARERVYEIIAAVTIR